MTVGFKWLEHGRGLPLPQRQSKGASGYDLAAALADGEALVIAPGAFALVPCGFALALPVGYEAQVRPRSGLAARHGVTVLNAPGTVDADYRGEVKAILVNHGAAPFEIRRGDRIAQMVVAAVPDIALVEVDELEETARGTGGFGSTGT
ncbi:dUTP diphosphatase [Pelagibacterium halotolerans]|uniref:Deoxyuridine 5'-triphosphate nucleotidohydrolase n=1 Tax=Pelagibacterium halotolerans (strain DSM 22347 / JCM 15775 / CGMCC 1.7692 / B2) TaxID=1082931 RepID=G4R8K9_PELHB|nr:dUTP diphosphatase [Pelagibacterium halotolerans]AEQ53414.1 deoxyuridine 5'-triphosphate nucleotidohydrolase [Pelagibacterium halotolerans B2]QJR20402.1 dUTP diphosphatase [Pelagibacterium halotolerans]SEA60945.1 dUTP pyrophosphatase [Pelagibacterium halotolerans]